MLNASQPDGVARSGSDVRRVLMVALGLNVAMSLLKLAGRADQRFPGRDRRCDAQRHRCPFEPDRADHQQAV